MNNQNQNQNNAVQAFFNLLNYDNCIVLNRCLIRSIGLAETAVYQSLLAKWQYYRTRGMLADGFFYSSIEDLQDSTSLGRKAQDRSIDRLVQLGLIFKKLQGMPCRRYFAINMDVNVLAKYLETPKIQGDSQFVQNGQTSLSERDKQDCPKGTNKIVQKGQTSLSEMDKQDCPKGANINISNTNINQSNIRDKNMTAQSQATDARACPPDVAPKVVKHKYGEYSNVLLSDAELEKLQNEFPNDWQRRIEDLSCYIASTGKSYKSHLATIRNWNRMDKQRQNTGFSMPTEDDDPEFAALFK